MVKNSTSLVGKNGNNEYAIYDKAIGWIITISMVVLVVVPMLVSLILLFHRNIDDVLAAHRFMVKDAFFPFVCILALVTYLIPIFVGKIKIKDFFRFLKRNPVVVIFLLLVVYFFISQIINAPNLLLIDYYHKWLGETFYMEVSYILFIFLGTTQIKDDNQKKLIYRAHLISSLFVPVAGQVIWYSRLDVTTDSLWRYTASIFPQQNNYGYYLAITVVLSAAMFYFEKNKGWKIFAFVSLIINSLAMSLNDTLGAWVAAVASLILLIVCNAIVYKKVGWEVLIIIPVFLVCLFIPACVTGALKANFTSLSTDIGKMVDGEDVNGIGTGRGVLWKEAIETIKENKLLGIGFEGVLYRYITSFHNIRPHSEFLQYALFHGIPAALLYFIGCFGIFIRALINKKMLTEATIMALITAFAYLVSSLFGLTLFSTAYFNFMFLGLGYVSSDVDIDVVK